MRRCPVALASLLPLAGSAIAQTAVIPDDPFFDRQVSFLNPGGP